MQRKLHKVSGCGEEFLKELLIFGVQLFLSWVAAKELKLKYHTPNNALLSTIYPYHGNSSYAPLRQLFVAVGWIPSHPVFDRGAIASKSSLRCQYEWRLPSTSYT